MNDKEHDERITNMILFGAPSTNKELEDIFGDGKFPFILLAILIVIFAIIAYVKYS